MTETNGNIGDDMTIEPSQVSGLVLEACPSFNEARLTLEDENIYDEERLYYIDAAELPAIFDLIERLIIEGDDYVQNLGVIGYLEGMQIQTIGTFDLDSEVTFRPWFRPASEAWWKRLNRSWEGEHTALQVSAEQISAEAQDPPNDDSS